MRQVVVRDFLFSVFGNRIIFSAALAAPSSDLPKSRSLRKGTFRKSRGLGIFPNKQEMTESSAQPFPSFLPHGGHEALLADYFLLSATLCAILPSAAKSGGEKMRIVLCDDDKAFTSELENRIRQVCDATGIRVSAIDVYTSSEKLVEEAERFAADGSAALFLDIDMPALSGFDVARVFQQKNAKCKVVFVTNKDELVFQSLEYHPFFFLRKAHLDEELTKQLAELDRLLNPRWTTLTFQEGRDTVTVPIEAISYAESEKNYLALYQDGEQEPRVYRIRMKLSDLQCGVAGQAFRNGILRRGRFIWRDVLWKTREKIQITVSLFLC